MKVLAVFATVSVGVSLGSLRTREPFVLGTSVDDARPTIRNRVAARRIALGEADEGLLDSELTTEDPIAAWLGRYLTPVKH